MNLDKISNNNNSINSVLGSNDDETTTLINKNISLNQFIKNKNYNINVSKEWTFCESIDIRALNCIVDNMDELKDKIGLVFNKQTLERESWESTKTILEKYRNSRIKSKPIIYQPSSKSKKGRHFSKDFSLQGIPRSVRHTISKNSYKDYDMKNCHPTILVSICQAYGYAHDKLLYYINNRDSCLNSLMDFTNWSKDDCKTNVLKLMNGGDINELFNYYGIELPQSCIWIKEFKDQLELIHKNVADQPNFDYHKKELIKEYGKKCFNFNGKLVNKVLCEFENILIQHAMYYCELNNIEIGSNCFDGLLLKINDKLDYQFLKSMEKYVVENVGIPITFVEKEMNEDFDLSGFLTNQEKKELEKEQKAREKELEKEQKAREKELEKEQKAREKELEKEQKAREKELEKEQKAREKELEKEQKARDKRIRNEEFLHNQFLERQEKKEARSNKERQKIDSLKFAEKLSDDVLSTIFIENTKNILFKDSIQNKLYIYNDDTFLYEPLESLDFLKNYFHIYLKDYIDSIEPKNDTETKKYNDRTLDLMNAKGLTNLLSVVKIKIPDSTEFIMNNFNRKNMIPFQDKVVDFNLPKNHENFIRTRCKDDYFTFTTDNEFLYDDYDYDWLIEYGKQLLMTDDITYVICLFTLLAHGLTTDNSIKLLIFFIGCGDNGKTAFMTLYKSLLKDLICTDASKAILKKGNSCLDTEKFMLIGKRVATLSELRQEDQLDINFVKQVTGDDKTIMLRPKADSSQIPVLIDCKIYVPTNEMPTIPEKDNALLKRIGCFNFCNVFERSSEKLKEIMSKKNDLFTYLCILASQLTLNKFEFHMCPQMLNFTTQVKDDIDTVQGFVNTCIEFTEDSNDFITANDLFFLYTNYCNMNDVKFLSNIAFGKKFTKKYGYNTRERKRQKKINGKPFDTYFFLKKRIIMEDESDEIVEFLQDNGVEESKNLDSFDIFLRGGFTIE
jgi:P4 family phage/plasmid primase-like protien